jgi:DNA-binding LytR/AlgR family response regulator
LEQQFLILLTMLKQLFSGPVYYNDRLIQIIAIPLIVFFSHYLTYDGSDSAGWYVYELFTDSIKVFLVWSTIRMVVHYLDRHIPWSGRPLRRLLVQLLATCVAGMVMLTGTNLLDYSLFRPYPLNHYSFDLVIAALFILIVNAVYIIIYYHQSLATTRQNLQDAKNTQLDVQERPGMLWVKLGKKQIAVPFAKIASFYAVNKGTLLYTTDGHSYPVDLSLDQLEKEPYTVTMFRANRQHLLSWQSIATMQPDEYGKINVRLKLDNHKEPVIMVSREKAAAFRQWLRESRVPVRP